MRNRALDGLPEGNISLSEAVKEVAARLREMEPGTGRRVFVTVEANPHPEVHQESADAMDEAAILLCKALAEEIMVVRYRDDAGVVCVFPRTAWDQENSVAALDYEILRDDWKIFPSAAVGHLVFLDRARFDEWLTVALPKWRHWAAPKLIHADRERPEGATQRRKPRPLGKESGAIERLFVHKYGGVVWPDHLTDGKFAEEVHKTEGIDVSSEQVRAYRRRAKGGAR